MCLAVWRGGRLDAASTGGDPLDGLPIVADVSRDGQTVAFFTQVDGLAPANAGSGQSTAKTVREVHLRRGFTSSRTGWDWRVAFLDGSVPKGEVTIKFYDHTFQEVAVWRLDRAYPATVSHSMGGGEAAEDLVVAYEGLTMLKP